MTEEAKKTLHEVVLNDLDHTFEDEALKKKIDRLINSGMAYLEDKFGRVVDFLEDKIALDLLISYCRYGRSNAIEQFEHDFKSNLTAFALRGAMITAQEEKKAQEGAQNEVKI